MGDLDPVPKVTRHLYSLFMYGYFEHLNQLSTVLLYELLWMH